ncbi:hypothetical protein TYRP_012170 [Tyrophagus putrescentiae]|nr:hypothetical protein TYRP_012170 [Tyrophagus putrescentiae]
MPPSMRTKPAFILKDNGERKVKLFNIFTLNHLPINTAGRSEHRLFCQSALHRRSAARWPPLPSTSPKPPRRPDRGRHRGGVLLAVHHHRTDATGTRGGGGRRAAATSSSPAEEGPARGVNEQQRSAQHQRQLHRISEFDLPLYDNGSVYILIISSSSRLHLSHQSTSTSAVSNEKPPVIYRRHSLVTTDHHIHPFPPPMSSTGAGGMSPTSAAGSAASLFSHHFGHHHHHHPQPMMMVAPMAASNLVPTQVYGPPANPYMYNTPYYPTQTIYYHAPSGNVLQTGYHSSGHSNSLLGSAMFGSFGSPPPMPAPAMPPPPIAASSEPEVQHILLEDIPTDTDYASEPYHSASSSHHPARFLSYADSFSSSDLFGSPSSKAVYRKKGHKKNRSRQRQKLYKDDYDDDYDPFSSKAKRRLKSAKQYSSSSFETFDDDGDFDDIGFKRIDGVIRTEQNCE